MAIHGVGIDLVDVERVRRLVEGSPERVRARIYTDHEWDYAHLLRDPYPRLAARFAAKEAGFKALRVPSWRGFSWRDIEVQSGAGGVPSLVYHEAAGELIRSLGIVAAHVTLSHLKTHALAVVVLESA